MNIKEKVIEPFRILNRKEGLRYALVALILVGLGRLNLLGAGIVGVIGSLVVNGIQSRTSETTGIAILNDLG